MEEIKLEEAKKDFKNETEEYLAKIGMTQEAFNKAGVLPRWVNYSAVGKFKSVRRAIRRGNADLISGVVYPRRPFNNRKVTNGRKFNELKKEVHGDYYKRAAY